MLYVYYLPPNYYTAIGFYSPVYLDIYYNGYGYNFYYGKYGYYQNSPNAVVHVRRSGGGGNTGLFFICFVAFICVCVCLIMVICRNKKGAIDEEVFEEETDEVVEETVIIEEREVEYDQSPQVYTMGNT